ncbi:MAG: DUF5989 family protein [Nitrososphaera sp.]|nr:DUF5989 family protein [Nitrososphaera sp.]
MNDRTATKAARSELMTPEVAESRKEKKKSGTGLAGRIGSMYQIMREFSYLTKRSGRGLWLIPMMGVLMLIAMMLIVIQVIEYVAPFVYTIF